MIPGGAIYSGSGAIGGAGIQQNPDYGQNPSSGVTVGRDPMNRQRYKKFSDALASASAYRDRAKDEAIIDASVGKNKDDDDKGTKGFKISPDTTVVEGYRDPGYTIPGQKGRSLLGTVGAFVSPFAPITGQAIGAVGNLTGI